jgi:hypothetical protein
MKKIFKKNNKTWEFTLYTNGWTLQEMFFIPLENGKHIKEVCLSRDSFYEEDVEVGRRSKKKLDFFLTKAMELIK